MFPITHDLEDLARKADLSLDKTQKTDLAIINTFHIAGRYDDYHLSFYKKATPAFTEKYFTTTQSLIQCLKKQLT